MLKLYCKKQSDEGMNDMKYRLEKDTLGEVEVPVDKLWGAQTQRSFNNFKIGNEKMPIEIIKAFAILKKSAAKTNAQLGLLEEEVADAIGLACDAILDGRLIDQFPLAVWQTGSGTQSNMNVNEVIAAYVNKQKKTRSIHPNDDVNKGQSSNDTFPTSMHISACKIIVEKVLPAAGKLIETLKKLEYENSTVVKTGRTHLQDATPLTFGQEISGWKYMIIQTVQMIEDSLKYLSQLALGGTAVGTGLNTHKEFAGLVAENISEETGYRFETSANKFHALTSKDAMVFSHGALNALAANLMKIANDVRLLSSGPRCGIGEITIPENEPGSSIMPGKINPTQCEALTMVAVQVMGNNASVAIAASQGNFELNVFMPVIAYNFLQSANLLADAMNSFNDNCAVGIKPSMSKINENLNKSLMLVTALNPYIGYEKSAKISRYAYENNLTLKAAALELNIISEEEFDRYVQPEKMI